MRPCCPLREGCSDTGACAWAQMHGHKYSPFSFTSPICPLHSSQPVPGLDPPQRPPDEWRLNECIQGLCDPFHPSPEPSTSAFPSTRISFGSREQHSRLWLSLLCHIQEHQNHPQTQVALYPVLHIDFSCSLDSTALPLRSFSGHGTGGIPRWLSPYGGKGVCFLSALLSGVNLVSPSQLGQLPCSSIQELQERGENSGKEGINGKNRR